MFHEKGRKKAGYLQNNNNKTIYDYHNTKDNA